MRSVTPPPGDPRRKKRSGRSASQKSAPKPENGAYMNMDTLKPDHRVTPRSSPSRPGDHPSNQMEDLKIIVDKLRAEQDEAAKKHIDALDALHDQRADLDRQREDLECKAEEDRNTAHASLLEVQQREAKAKLAIQQCEDRDRALSGAEADLARRGREAAR
eukprot:gene4237-4536_t